MLLQSYVSKDSMRFKYNVHWNRHIIDMLLLDKFLCYEIIHDMTLR